MNDEELIAYFNNRDLPKGRVQFSGYELTDDVAHMVALAIERVCSKRTRADTACDVLLRLRTHLEREASQQPAGNNHKKAA